MRLLTLIKRSLRFRARQHIGVLLGAAIGTATLTGALIVGDSVRFSLQQMAIERLGRTYYAIQTRDRLFTRTLANLLRLTEPSPPFLVDGKALAKPPVPGSSAAVLQLPGTLSRQDGTARANHVNVLAVDSRTWPRFAAWDRMGSTTRTLPSGKAMSLDAVRAMELGWDSARLTPWVRGESLLVNEALAHHLNLRENDEVILRVRKPSALSQEAVISPQDETAIALRFRIGAIVPASMLGNFSLASFGAPPMNVFLPLEYLSHRVGQPGRANVLLHGPITAAPAVRWWDQQRIRLLSWLPRRPPPPGAQQRIRVSAPLPQGMRVDVVPGEPLPDDASVKWLNSKLQKVWRLEDTGLSVEAIEQPQSATGGEYIRPFVQITSEGIFLNDTVISAALKPRTRSLPEHPQFQSDSPADVRFSAFVTNGIRVFTYLANLIKEGERATPYSMITAADQPFVPADMRDDEILVNEWLAKDLNLKTGATLHVSYYLADSGSRLVERTNAFRVSGIVPMRGIYADRTLMPEFPGLAKAERTQDWDAGFPLKYEIREKDEDYWKNFRGTPKAFITLAAGQAMWSNRFGNLTSIRFEVPTNGFASVYRKAVALNLLANVQPADVGLEFEPVRERALQGAAQAQDFGQLFLGFSFFLVAAAFLLMGLMFRLTLEGRAEEVGMFLAMGFRVRQVRKMLLIEGVATSVLGGLLGTLAGVGYAALMIWGLTTIWNAAIGGASLLSHVSVPTLLIGFVTAALVCAATLWFALWRYGRRTALELLTGETRHAGSRGRSRAKWLGWLAGGGAMVLITATLVRRESQDPGTFFGAGALLLISGLAFARVWLNGRHGEPRGLPSLGSLGFRAASRQPLRSLGVIALLAAGTFIIAAIGVFRLDAGREAGRPGSGTGGFELIGETALPVIQDLNTEAGREFFALDNTLMQDVQVVPFRVHEGDEASCLNLSRAQRPRVLGVNPELLKGRFTFVGAADGLDRQMGWDLLKAKLGPGEIPAIGDANSIQWALGRKLGDSLEYTDEEGRLIKLRLVGAVGNSVLQGVLIVDEAEFGELFQGESGYGYFLIDIPEPETAAVAAGLGRGLQDQGLEITPAVERLNQFNAVQNTYLGTFQVLGGLGLLLGSAGLGVVLFRNVLERRGELALLTAVGFRRRQIGWMLIGEHGILLLAGLGLGMVAAAVAVLPEVVSPGRELPWVTLSVTLAGVLVNGLLWVVMATRAALRGDLLSALRNE